MDLTDTLGGTTCWMKTMSNAYNERKLVKIERTRTEIRDDVAIRIYTELVMETHIAHGEFPDADRLRELSENALDAAFVFYQERYADKRLLKESA